VKKNLCIFSQLKKPLLFAGKEFGVTDFVNPSQLGDKSVSEVRKHAIWHHPTEIIC
jgi:hypothetical protein